MPVQSIDRILDILEAFASEPKGLGITELAQKVNLHKSTTSRLANVLRSRDYLVKDEQSRKFKLGVKFIELSASFLGSFDLRTEAQPIMSKTSAETGQTIYLALLHANKVIYIDKTDRHSAFESLTIVGKQAPIYSTALGKALLMGQSQKKLEHIFDNLVLQKKTINTKTDKTTLIKEIINAQFFTEDDEENEPNTYCIASPIYDYKGKVVAAVSISVSKNNITAELRHFFQTKIIEASLCISAKMGYKKP